MTLCKFYQQGYCKFGSSCRFEHPAANNRNQPSRTFGAPVAGGSNQQLQGLDKYNITLETIEKDLTTERPLWILSAYAPGKGAPQQLFGGYPREQSFEELRLHYLNGKAAGKEQETLNEEQQLYAHAEEQIKNAVVNLKQAAQFILDGENQHPNRQDICVQGTQGAPFGQFGVGQRPGLNASGPNPFGNAQSSSPFGGAAAQGGGGAFGQPSALGQRPNPFGASSSPSPSPFGQPSQLGAGAQASPFGQPAQPAQSAFGQPSAFGAKPNPFGQPSQPAAQGGAFGQQGQLGQASQPMAQGGAFGQQSQLGQAPQPNAQAGAFGQPSQLGQAAQPGAQPSPFGQPSQLGARPNPFGSSAAPSASPFAQPGAASNAPANPFGSTNNNNANPSPFASAGAAPSQSSPFGAPSTNTQAAPAANPFGQPQQTQSPFAQTAAPAANPFASGNQAATQNASNPFGQQQPQQQQSMGGFANQGGAQNPFGQPQSSPFGQPSNLSAQANAPQAAQDGSAKNPYPPGSTKQHPPPSSYITTTMDGRIASFKGKPVTYQNGKPGIREFNGVWQRIWFPDGPPMYYKDTEFPPEKYDGKSKSQWAAFAQTGNFADGLMPELPPPREVTSWDF